MISVDMTTQPTVTYQKEWYHATASATVTGGPWGAYRCKVCGTTQPMVAYQYRRRQDRGVEGAPLPERRACERTGRYRGEATLGCGHPMAIIVDRV